MPEPRLLLVDDEEDLRWLLTGCLRESGFDVVEAASAEAASRAFAALPAQVVVSDVRMPGRSGVDLLEELRRADPKLPVILMSAVEDVATAVQAMKLGAYDFLTKPFENERLVTVVRRALETSALHQEVHRLRTQLSGRAVTFGVSKQARELERRVRLLAETPGLSLLLQGESGTGKEVVARTIHDWSPRRAGPFVAVDCGALPEPLLESLLFGHRRGAFTGADQDRTGLFVEADHGTLFLDEMGNLPAGLQAKLLRCLQEREVRPLGSDKPVPFDVRLIAAANVDLQAETQRGRFRLDLYHRVAEFVVRIPPLRERPEDVLHFADCFLAKIAEESGREPARLTAAARAHLSAHGWPGNLRELGNCLRRAALLAASDELGVEDLDLAPATQALVPGFEDGTPLTDQVQAAALRIERAWIEQVLEATAGNKAEAARRLGVDYTTLHRKLKRHGLDTMAPAP